MARLHLTLGTDACGVRFRCSRASWSSRRRHILRTQARGCCRGSTSNLGHGANADSGQGTRRHCASRDCGCHRRRRIVRANSLNRHWNPRRAMALPRRGNHGAWTFEFSPIGPQRRCSLVLFAALLVVPSLTERATGSHAIALFDAFYRSGALVFGGAMLCCRCCKRTSSTRDGCRTKRSMAPIACLSSSNLARPRRGFRDQQ